MRCEFTLPDMSIEGQNNSRDKLVRALTFIGAVTSAGAMGVETGKNMNTSIEEINEHVITPAAMKELKREGATNEEIHAIDNRLHDLMLQELDRLRGEK